MKVGLGGYADAKKGDPLSLSCQGGFGRIRRC